MNNYIQPGNVVDLTAPAGGVVGGMGYIIGGIFGVAVRDAAEGEKVGFQVKGVVELPKDTATAMSEGDLVEWKTADTELVADAAGDLDAGLVLEDKLAADTTVKILLLR